MRHKKIHSFLILLAMILLITTVAYAADPLMITTTRLPSAELGKEYSAQLTAGGGDNSKYTFFIQRGALPDGLTLTEDGLLHGVPTQGGMFGGIYFGVRDAENNVATKKIVVRINSKTVNFTVADDRQEYDGSPHIATVVPSTRDITADDYIVTYGGEESQTNIGAYEIRVQGVHLQEKGYQVGSIFPGYMVITANASSTIRLASGTFEYDGQPHGLNPIVTPAEIENDYTLNYRGRGDTVYGPSDVAPSAVGTYTVTATTNNSNYVTRTATANLTIIAPRVNFTVENANVTYNGSPQKALITPVNYDGNDYNVTYDDLATDDVEELTEVNDAGQYRININFDNPTHQAGTMTTNTFVINPKRVDFIVTDNEMNYNPANSVYKAIVQADDTTLTESEDFQVKYVVGEEKLDAVTDVGTYDIEVDFIGDKERNYTVGDITPKHLTVNPLTVNFTISTPGIVYDPNRVEAYSANVSSDSEGFKDNDFVVTYEKDGQTYQEGEVTKAGTYIVKVALTEEAAKHYRMGTGSQGEFTVLPCTVDFTVSGDDVTYNPGTDEYKAAVLPSFENLKENQDFQVTYTNTTGGEPIEAVTNAGIYDINIELIGEAANNYQIGNIGSKIFTLKPFKINFIVNEPEVTYDPAVNSYHTTVNATNLEDCNDFRVLYRLGDEAPVSAVTAAGTYDVVIELGDTYNSNYQVGTIEPSTFTLKKRTVNFSLTDIVTDYAPGVNEYKAAVTADIVDFEEHYTVVYTKGGEESLNSVSNAGEYRIDIRLHDDVQDKYEIGSVGTAEENIFTVHPCVVNFTITGNTVDYNPDVEEYAATVKPGIDGFKSYSVVYIQGENRYPESIPNSGLDIAGLYDIGIDISDSNYTAGIVTGKREFVINQPAAKIVLGDGNSPMAMIGDDETAQGRFKNEHIYNGVTYSTNVWGNDKNLDEDRTAYFIIDGKAAWSALTCRATYSDGTLVPEGEISVLIEGLSPVDWLAAKPQSGIYEMTYSFVENETTLSETRKLVVLNRMGDTNSDRNINAGDARYLQSVVLNDLESQTPVYLYRVCDVNHDGVVDDQDAAAIMNRMNVPLVGYYQ